LWLVFISHYDLFSLLCSTTKASKPLTASTLVSASRKKARKNFENPEVISLSDDENREEEIVNLSDGDEIDTEDPLSPLCESTSQDSNL